MERVEQCGPYQEQVLGLKRKSAETITLGEPKLAHGVQEHEDARTSHPCERRASNCKATCGSWRGKS
jgi:hypothetical protein